MNKFCTCIFTICVILCSCIICNATVLPYVDVVSKQELPKGVHVGKYNFTYGEEQESIVADDGIQSKTVLLDDSKGLGYIYYRNGIYLICDTSADFIPEHKMSAGAMRKNSPVYFFDSEMNLLNKIEFDGYMKYKKYENGNFFLSLQKASGGMVYYKTSDGVNLIEVTEEEFNAESIESKMTLLCNGDLADGKMLLHQGTFLPIIYESGADKIYWDRKTTGMVMRSEEYDENRNMVYQGISYDGVTFYEVPTDLSSGGNTIFTDKYLYYLKTINGKRTNPEEYYRISVEALNSGIKIICNGKYLSFARPPVIENDRTLVPMRFLFEQMGDTVTWDEDTMTATASNGENIVAFGIDDCDAMVNGATQTMDVPARLINDKTYVPLRFLSENLGYTVTWDEATRTASIITE